MGFGTVGTVFEFLAESINLLENSRFYKVTHFETLMCSASALVVFLQVFDCFHRKSL